MKELDISHSGISRVCNNIKNYKICGGFHWVYHEQHKSLEIIQQFGHYSSSDMTMKNYIEHRASDINKNIFDDESEK